MGMYDSMFDRSGNEWQTKAFECMLDCYKIGDIIRLDLPHVLDFQVKVLGGGFPSVESFATIRDGRLNEVPAERDASLALMDYVGGWIEAAS